MRWLKYSLGGTSAYGILEGDRILEVRGDPFRGYERTPNVLRLEDVRIEVPVRPGTFFAVGQNYATHAQNYPGGTAAGAPQLPTRPDVGFRAAGSLTAHGETVLIPKDAPGEVHYEAELVVVIGKTAKSLGEDEVKHCILGYTIGNDVSERAWQRSDRTVWRAKNSDTFAPMGPWIETDIDLAAMETIVSVNGTETTRFATGDMLFDVEAFVSAISRYMTLRPGDVLWMGTEGTSPNLRPGDWVDIMLTGIGTLSNRFAPASR